MKKFAYLFLAIVMICGPWAAVTLSLVPQELIIPLITATTTLLIGVIGADIAASSLITAARINLKNKIADCVMHCNTRYDSIYVERTRIQKEFISLKKSMKATDILVSDTDNYYSRYWGLKRDQFDYWLSGLIDAESMCGYYYSVLRSFQSGGDAAAVDNPFGSIGFREAWQKGQEHNRAADPIFTHLIDELIGRAETLDGYLLNGRPKQAYEWAYDEVINLFDKIEKGHEPLIEFMTNVPRMHQVAPRGTMSRYRSVRQKSSLKA